MEDSQNSSPCWNLIVFGFLFIILGLSIRGFFADDTRYGWGMFAYQLNYRLDYFWVLEGEKSEANPRLEPYSPKEELKGYSNKVAGGVWKYTRYGYGALQTWVRGFIKYKFTQQPKAGAIAFVVYVRYAKNKKKIGFREVYHYPLENEISKELVEQMDRLLKKK